MFRLQIFVAGSWKWGTRDYATKENALTRVKELAKAGIISRVKPTAELLN